MKNIIYGFLVVIAFMAMTSCNDGVRESDIPVLTAEAEEGNLRAMEALVIMKNTPLSPETLAKYETTLLEHGNSTLLNKKLDEATDEAEQLEWLKYGAEHGNASYMVKLGDYYRDANHADLEESTRLYKQACDSLNALARIKRLEWSVKSLWLMDYPTRSFAQAWKESSDYSFVGRLTVSVVAFVSGYAVGVISLLFTAAGWWRALIGIVLVIILLALMGKSAKFGLHEYGIVGSLPTIVSMLYGVFNGFALFLRGAWTGELDITARFIGQFFRLPGTFSELSDYCITASWIWLISFAFLFAIGAFLVYRSDVDELWKYVLLTVLMSLLSYFLGVIISGLSFILLAGYFIYGLGQNDTGMVLKGAGPWGGDLKITSSSNGIVTDENGKRYRNNYDGTVTPE